MTPMGDFPAADYLTLLKVSAGIKRLAAELGMTTREVIDTAITTREFDDWLAQHEEKGGDDG